MRFACCSIATNLLVHSAHDERWIPTRSIESEASSASRYEESC